MDQPQLYDETADNQQHHWFFARLPHVSKQELTWLEQHGWETLQIQHDLPFRLEVGKHYAWLDGGGLVTLTAVQPVDKPRLLSLLRSQGVTHFHEQRFLGSTIHVKAYYPTERGYDEHNWRWNGDRFVIVPMSYPLTWATLPAEAQPIG